MRVSQQEKDRSHQRILDSAARLIRWNESLRLLNGLSDDEIMGSDPFANIVESDRAATVSRP